MVASKAIWESHNIKLLFLLLTLLFGLMQPYGAFAFLDEGPGFLPRDVEDTANEILPTADAATNHINSKPDFLLKEWKAGYEKLKGEQRQLAYRISLLVRIADIEYQQGNLVEAEKSYKLASDSTEKDLDLLRGHPSSQHDVSVSALYSYACFLAEHGRVDEASRLMRIIYRLLRQPTAYNFNVGFGGCDDFGTFLAIVKEKYPKTYREFYPQWRANKEASTPNILPQVSGFKIDVADVEQMSDFIGDRAVARDRLTCRYGYVDRSGRWAIPPTFIAANPFSDGIATAKLSSGKLPIEVEGTYDHFSLIDLNGKEIVKLPTANVSQFYGPFLFAEGHSRTPSSMIFDRNGNVLYSGKFRYRSHSDHKLTIFEVTGDRNRGCIVEETGDVKTLELKADAEHPGHFKLVPVSAK